MRNEKIIFDTNLWISFLISNKFSQMDELIENEKIILICSNAWQKKFFSWFVLVGCKNFSIGYILSFEGLYLESTLT